MPSFTRSLIRRNRSARLGLHVEALERREVLAALGGNVAAQLVGSTLLLTGDSFGNQLVVASVAGGKIAVIGNDTTVNGSVEPFVTNKPVVSIIANLNGGDDGIGFGNNAQGFADQLDALGILAPFDIAALQIVIDDVADGATRFSLPGSLVITTDGGTDFVGIIGDVGGSLSANLGSAPTGPDSGNALMIGGLIDPAYASRVGGGVSIVGGAQRDGIELAGTTVGGGVAVALGNGENYLGLYESSMASLAYTGGAADDNVDAADLRVRYGVSIVTGAGADEVYLHEHDSGPQTVVGGSMAINTGADDDYVEISSAVSGALSLVTGTGDDEVRIYETSVGLNAVIDTGTGDDSVAINLTRIRYNLFVSLGAGNDDLELTAVSAFAAYLYGGPGTNSLDIDSASRTGIRRLFYTQFQTVT